MKQVALFDKRHFEEDSIQKMSKDEAINVALHNNGIACVRSKKEIEEDKKKFPEKYSSIIIKELW